MNFSKRLQIKGFGTIVIATNNWRKGDLKAVILTKKITYKSIIPIKRKSHMFHSIEFPKEELLFFSLFLS